MVISVIALDKVSYANKHDLLDWQKDNFQKSTFHFEIPEITNPILFEHVLTTTIEKLKSATKHNVSKTDKVRCKEMALMGFDYEQCLDNCAVKSTTSSFVDNSVFKGNTKISSVVMIDPINKKRSECFYGFLPSKLIAHGWIFFTSHETGYKSQCTTIEADIKALAKLHLDNEFEVYTRL
jgi:hypothetical protein